MKYYQWEIVLNELIKERKIQQEEQRRKEEGYKDIIYFPRNGYINVTKPMQILGVGIGSHGQKWTMQNCHYENFHGILFRKVDE